MTKPRLIHVPEPQLEFRFGQTVDYPRDGLYLFGPVDAAREPRHVRYGVIGTPDSLRRLKEWASQVSGFISVPPPTRMSKPIEAHHVAFPGFSEAFFATWQTEPTRTITDIDERQLLYFMRIANRHGAIKTAVDVFVDRLVADRKRDEDPPSFWYVVIPEFIYELGRPQSIVAVADRVMGKITLEEKQVADLPCNQPCSARMRRKRRSTNMPKTFGGSSKHACSTIKLSRRSSAKRHLHRTNP